MSRPIHFVHHGLSEWKDLEEVGDGEVPSLDDIAGRLTTGRDVWIVTTYVVLRQLGCHVRLSASFKPDHICIAHHDDVGGRNLSFLSYVVAVRADRDRTFACDVEIVQSPSVIEGPNQHYVPHWPQSGLTPRDEARGSTIKRIGYIGRRRNLAERFRSAEFRTALGKLGMELVIREDSESWHDYSDLDLVLAIREGKPYFLAGKPVTKLVNAWRAGCPAIVGSEPVYWYHRESPLDFLHAESPKEVLEVLRRLERNPDLYRRMVVNGKRRAKEFTHERIASKWSRLLYGPIMAGFLRWRQRAAPSRRLGDACRHLYRETRKRLRGQQYSRG